MALAPDVAAVDLEAAVAHRDAGLHRRFESRQVFLGHEAAVLAVIGGDVVGDRALVEAVVRGAQLRRAVARRLALGLDHALDGAREIGLPEPVAHRGRAAARPEDGGVLWIAIDLGGVDLERVAQLRIHVEAVARELIRGRHRLLEAERAEAPQRLDVRRRRGGKHLAQDALGHALAALGAQACDVGRRRPVAEARERDHAVFGLEVDQRRRDAGEANDVGLQHRKRHGGGHAGVDRIAARIEHAHRRGGREIVPAGNRVVASRHRRPP